MKSVLHAGAPYGAVPPGLDSAHRAADFRKRPKWFIIVDLFHGTSSRPRSGHRRRTRVANGPLLLIPGDCAGRVSAASGPASLTQSNLPTCMRVSRMTLVLRGWTL